MHPDYEPAQLIPDVPRPPTNVADEAACNSHRNSFFDKQSRILIVIDLFKI
jgi:hypothetical protein